MNPGSYRYGFNGKENDPETGTQDYGLRIYNPDIAKFLSVDPLTKDYPWYTPYQFAGNKPIQYVDIDGAEEGDPPKPGENTSVNGEQAKAEETSTYNMAKDKRGTYSAFLGPGLLPSIFLGGDRPGQGGSNPAYYFSLHDAHGNANPGEWNFNLGFINYKLPNSGLEFGVEFFKEKPEPYPNGFKLEALGSLRAKVGFNYQPKGLNFGKNHFIGFHFDLGVGPNMAGTIDNGQIVDNGFNWLGFNKQTDPSYTVGYGATMFTKVDYQFTKYTSLYVSGMINGVKGIDVKTNHGMENKNLLSGSVQFGVDVTFGRIGKDWWQKKANKLKNILNND